MQQYINAEMPCDTISGESLVAAYRPVGIVPRHLARGVRPHHEMDISVRDAAAAAYADVVQLAPGPRMSTEVSASFCGN